MYVLRAQQFGYLGFAVRGRQCHSPLFGLNIGVSVYLIVCMCCTVQTPMAKVQATMALVQATIMALVQATIEP